MVQFTLNEDDFEAFTNGLEYVKQTHAQGHHGELEINGIHIEWNKAGGFKITIEEE